MRYSTQAPTARPDTHSLQTFGLAITFFLGIFLSGCSNPETTMRQNGTTTNETAAVRLMTLEPGHFHAALVQKEMYADVSQRVHIYSPLGFDLREHLKRIEGFNTRPENPTGWELEIHTDGDSLQRMLRERPGNVVILSGRNQGKIDRIKASVEAGLHVLVDKPWIIREEDFPKLEATFATAKDQKLVAYDIMTERYEVTTILQKELLHTPDVFGEILMGSEAEPAVYIESIHHLLKLVAGNPNIRPAWFFDVTVQGEGVADVGTHLVDLVQWMLFPEQAIDYRQEIQVKAGRRWPTVLSLDQFSRVTNERQFPASLAKSVRDGKLDYFSNGSMTYALRGVHTKLDVIWNYEAPPGGGDTHVAIFRGSKARIEIRQGATENWRPELYVIPNQPTDKAALRTALTQKIVALQATWPGLAVEEKAGALWITIPDKYREGHEPHFAQVARRFFAYLRDPQSIPAWEAPNMLAKYYTTTRGLALGYQK
jgi:predicted dehydrogenase